MNIICFQLGISILLTPILIKEIIYFPQDNNISKFVKDHQHKLFCLLLFLNLIFVLIIKLSDFYEIVTIIVDNGINYNICKVKGTFNFIIVSLFIVYEVLIFITIVLLTFIEWNINGIRKDIRNYSMLLYCNFLLAFFLILTKVINFRNIYLYFLLKISVPFLFGIVNYFILIWMRIYQEKNYQYNRESIKIVKGDIDNKIDNKTSDTSKKNLKNKIISYHYYKESSFDTIDNTNSILKDVELVVYSNLIRSDQNTDILYLTNDDNKNEYK
ncbi:hypothetical protein BCR32DRAFT_251872 [Anaeromyces robustus]|uniref:G-protein coupled receptors family 3 profile domain-containing protein n=1 Tax=Anaeromyces robustus TaxID=1754192 RepID=A0A1Y1V639_9FUNG|nr:hypothetical protein BCR32DRAFT_251872 [Anaeromyces robustus]|eukprot:ORX47394.1 hypothetical protein BCR32DRAFT_251872 [Anaeromyces robustus]